MELSSLAYRTDLIFHRHTGEVVDRGDYLVVRNPDNPTYYFGNLLIFGAPPAPATTDDWLATFGREIGAAPGHHLTVGWDGDELGDTARLVDRGLTLVTHRVLIADELPPAPASALQVRPLDGDADWQRVAELNRACDPQIDDSDAYREFRHRSRRQLRAMVEAGVGRWLGGFAGDELVAQMGIFAESGLGRFRDVETHPEHRRQGAASALVREALRLGLGELGADQVICCCDADSEAERVYLRSGFRPLGWQHAAFTGAFTGGRIDSAGAAD